MYVCMCVCVGGCECMLRAESGWVGEYVEGGGGRGQHCSAILSWRKCFGKICYMSVAMFLSMIYCD